MKLIAPDYYPHFRCIAGACRHSCCIGWEIDIDPDTRERYRQVGGEMGARLARAIHDGGEGACFILGEGERCPMLRVDGLCELICALGEDALCQICADHPRYRSFFTDRTEIGLGLCCEAAARLALGWEKPAALLTLEDDGENEEPDGEEAWLLAQRDGMIQLLQRREWPMEARLTHLAETYPLPAWPDEQWRSLLRGLERLDPAWDAALDRISLQGPMAHDPSLDTAMEQLGVYLLYRHLPGALEDGDLPGRVKLAQLGVRLISGLCAAHQRQWGCCTLEDCAEYARMFSAEIEYSEDNIAALLEALEEA